MSPESQNPQVRAVLDLAPGNILQACHFRRRIRRMKRELSRPPRFIELGAGTGWLSRVALAEGCVGTGYDLNAEGCKANVRRNAEPISAGSYKVVNEAFDRETVSSEGPVELVFSCMVLEHLAEDEIHHVLSAARKACRSGGIFAAFVPAGMRYWGIEDEVAGHLRRYELSDFLELGRREGLSLRYWTGLTFPLSNFLRGISDHLVQQQEASKLQDPMYDRTVASGHREVRFKTRFPPWMRWILNQWALWPFDALQRLFGRSTRSMVLYGEWELPPY